MLLHFLLKSIFKFIMEEIKMNRTIKITKHAQFYLFKLFSPEQLTFFEKYQNNICQLYLSDDKQVIMFEFAKRKKDELIDFFTNCQYVMKDISRDNFFKMHINKKNEYNAIFGFKEDKKIYVELTIK